MAMLVAFILAIFGVMGFAGGTAAETAYILERDIVYDVVTGRDGDGIQRTERLKLDFYRPIAAAGPTPLLIYVHGGCYVSGTKAAVPAFLRALAADGIAIASLDYRMARDPRRPSVPQHHWPYPAGLTDVQQAVRFLRKNADRFDIDTSRIATHGESTGGYFAAALGVRPMPDRAGKLDAYADRIDIVSDWYGRTDFTLPKSPTGLPCHEFWLGKPLTEASKPEFEKAGLLPHVDSRSADHVLILHGDKDPQVDVIHSIKLAERLRARDKDVRFYLNQGYGHNFSGSTMAEAVTRRFLLDALVEPVDQPVLSELQLNAGWTNARERGPLPSSWKTDRYLDTQAQGSTIVYDGCRDKTIARAPSELAPLYWDVRFGKTFGYRIPVANGVYRLRLHFAECRYTTIGQRRFDVRLFAIPVLRNYDVLAATGGAFATADVQELGVIVRNGQIDLSFATRSSNNANLAALELERLF
jgi:acetyl esterase/lipase